MPIMPIATTKQLIRPVSSVKEEVPTVDPSTIYRGAPDEGLKGVYPEQYLLGLGWKLAALRGAARATPYVAKEVSKNAAKKAAARKAFFEKQAKAQKEQPKADGGKIVNRKPNGKPC